MARNLITQIKINTTLPRISMSKKAKQGNPKILRPRRPIATKGITGKINRLINSAIVLKKAERYPLSTTERLVEATNDYRTGATAINPNPPRTTRVINTVSNKLIFYAILQTLRVRNRMLTPKGFSEIMGEAHYQSNITCSEPKVAGIIR